MNYISCTIRILEIPTIKLLYNKIPLIKFKAEIAKIRNNQSNIIINAKIWGDLTYELIKYYQVNDYLLIEGYFSKDCNYTLDLALRYKKDITISIFKIYPYFCLF